jgi:hypothetical protein
MPAFVGQIGQYRKMLGDIAYKAMIDVINAPANDKFGALNFGDQAKSNGASSHIAVTAGDFRIQSTPAPQAAIGSFGPLP